jgi:hypothetical protein
MLKKTALCLFALLISGAILFESLSARAVTFTPPAREAPKRTTGGGSRDDGKCLSSSNATEVAIAPLLPDTNLGLTVAERPTVFVYVGKTAAKEAFFSIQDEQENHHYQTTIKLPEQASAIGIQLPNEAPPLQVGKNYKWSLVLICGQQLEPDHPKATGWIHRIESYASRAQYESTVSLKSVLKLADAGLWYDTISRLAQLRQVQPKNPHLAAHWEELLTSVGLDEMATEPIVMIEDVGQKFSHQVKTYRAL